jgi:cytohesin
MLATGPYLWYVAAVPVANVDDETLVRRLDTTTGRWLEMPPCPVAMADQIAEGDGMLWLGSFNGLASIRLTPSIMTVVKGLNKAPLPPDEEIFLAIQHHDRDEVQALLKQGVSANVRSKWGQTPLQIAVGYADIPVIQLLFDHGADANAQGTGQPPVLYAALDQPELARLLLKRGANPNLKWEKDYPPLIQTIIRTRNLEVLRALLDAGGDVNQAEPLFGMTPLIAAARSGIPQMVETVLARNPRLNDQDKEGMTALIYASGYDQAKGFGPILAAGADVNLRGKKGETALHMAAQAGSPEKVGQLLKRGANLEATQENGWTPLIAAASQSRGDNVRVLIEAGANVNVRSRTGQTALMFCVVRHDLESIRRLLSKGADPNASDENGKTPLGLAGGDVEAQKLLRQAGAR